MKMNNDSSFKGNHKYHKLKRNIKFIHNFMFYISIYIMISSLLTVITSVIEKTITFEEIIYIWFITVILYIIILIILNSYLKKLRNSLET